MSMTKNEFVQRFRDLWWGGGSGGASFVEKTVALIEEAGVEWAPEPTPEPTGDLSMVRVIDAEGNTWSTSWVAGWFRIDGKRRGDWSDIPQPATVLRPEEGCWSCLT